MSAFVHTTTVESADSARLALLGKKEVLKRRFGLASLFGFAVCELITWETVLALFSQGLDNGGPAGLVYGFIIAWSSTLSVYSVISELASLAPIAAGQYYWVYMLAPQKYKKISSYLVGWLTSLAWIATVATECIFAGTIIQGLIILDYPDYEGTLWQGTLFSWLIVAVAIFVNAIIPNFLPKLEIGVVVFHIAGFIAIVATLLVMTPSFTSAHTVFATSLNEGGWPTQGLSYCVGFLGNVATFVGADASVHMAEEVANAAINIPRAILASMLINGVVGFSMMITLLFCLGDMDTVLESATGYPFIQIFYDSVGNVAGATAMAAVVTALTWACATGIITTASRMTWSFARDRGLPFHKYLSRVSEGNRIPIISLLTVTGLACLLTLIYIGSSVAFNDVISLTITGFYSSYFLPSALLLYHRVKGNIKPYGSVLEGVPVGEESKDEKIVEKEMPLDIARAPLVWGPWHLPGWFGIINNAYACVYMIFVIFWSVWPPATPVSAESMNYSIVVTGGVIVLAFIWYHIRGKKEYNGPIIDTEVADVLRNNSIARVESHKAESHK